MTEDVVLIGGMVAMLLGCGIVAPILGTLWQRADERKASQED